MSEPAPPPTLYRFHWANNAKRRTLKGRRCLIEATGRMGSVQIRFLDDGSREIVSRRALRIADPRGIARMDPHASTTGSRIQEAAMEVTTNEIDAKLDELADIGVHWTRNRQRGLTPEGVKGAMLSLVEEILDLRQREAMPPGADEEETE